MTTPRKLFRILSIDGGGIRGAIPTSFLASLERQLGASPVECFDYFAGTSAGGLISLYLGGLGGTAEKACELFSASRGAQIMDKSLFDRIVPVALQPGPKYDGKGKTAALNEVFGDARMNDARKPTLITAYDPAVRRFAAFKSHGGYDARNNPLMAQVADATSAAPMYFPPARVIDNPDRLLIDGAIATNNPAMSALSEALKAGFSPLDIVLVSIGTGHIEPSASQRREYERESSGWGGLDWLRHGIIEHLIDATSAASDYWCTQILGPRYIRVQGGLAAGASAEMDAVSASNIEALRATGDQWYAQFGPRVMRAVNREGVAFRDARKLPTVRMIEEQDAQHFGSGAA